MSDALDDAPCNAWEEQAADWCVRLADRPLTDSERLEFEAWLEDDPQHRQALEDMVAAWQWTDAIAGMPGFLSLRAKALEAMESASARKVDAARKWGVFGVRSLAMAAMVCLMLAGGIWHLLSGPDVYATDVGERRVVILDDGSRISLDAASEVSVALTPDRRTIVLDHGRARFDVAKDSLRPFTVTAGKRTVVAVGTEFTVELLHDEMRVLLYEGKVDVVSRDPSEKSRTSLQSPGDVDTLTPGQELVASLATGAAKVASADTERTLAWEEGRLDFENEPLARAVERMNRYSDKPIVIRDPAVGRHLINGVFDAGDTTTFVSGITALYPVSAQGAGNRIVLTSAKKSSGKKEGRRSDAPAS